MKKLFGEEVFELLERPLVPSLLSAAPLLTAVLFGIVRGHVKEAGHELARFTHRGRAPVFGRLTPADVEKGRAQRMSHDPLRDMGLAPLVPARLGLAELVGHIVRQCHTELPWDHEVQLAAAILNLEERQLLLIAENGLIVDQPDVFGHPSRRGRTERLFVVVPLILIGPGLEAEDSAPLLIRQDFLDGLGEPALDEPLEDRLRHVGEALAEAMVHQRFRQSAVPEAESAGPDRDGTGNEHVPVLAVAFVRDRDETVRKSVPALDHLTRHTVVRQLFGALFQRVFVSHDDRLEVRLFPVIEIELDRVDLFREMLEQIPSGPQAVGAELLDELTQLTVAPAVVAEDGLWERAD